MIELEMNIKLAKDIASLRLINMSKAKLASTSLQEELKTAMHDLDSRREKDILIEISDILKHDAHRKDPRVHKMFDKTYLNVMQRKLKIRAKQKSIDPFTPENYADVDAVLAPLLNFTLKALEDAGKSGVPNTVIPYALYEIFSFNKHKTLKAINNAAGLTNCKFRITDFELTPLAAGSSLCNDLTDEGIYEVQGSEYYGVTIYERFNLRGIIVGTIAEAA